MFKSISKEEWDFKKVPFNEMKDNLLKSKFSIGNNELYKDTWESTFKDQFKPHSLKNNCFSTVGLPHLIPNRSTVDISGEQDKRKFLTSFKRDFIPLPYSKNNLNVDVQNLIKNSKVKFGEDKLNYSTQFKSDFQNPSTVKPKYNFDKINFKLRDFSMHPIRTLEEVSHNLIYEHYDPKRKNHHRQTSNIPQIVHKNYYYTWDNITHRYLK